MVSMLGPSHLMGDIYIPRYNNIEENLDKLETFIPKDTDYFLCSYPKSGTHWVNEIMRMLLSGKAEYDPAPICNMESGNYGSTSQDNQSPAEPRVLHTHLPCQMLPQTIMRQKIVYVMRNPKDQIVSLYHHHQGLKWSPTLSFSEFFHQVINEPHRVEYGDWFRNAYEWWLRYYNAKNVLFLFYEDLIFDLEREIMKIVRFHNLTHLSTEFIREVVHKTTLSQMKTEKPVEEWFTHWHKESFTIYRKGKVGNWQSYFTDEMNEVFDDFCQRMAGNVPYPVNYCLGITYHNQHKLQPASTVEKIVEQRKPEITLLAH